MTNPIVFSSEWEEDEPTGRGGARVRYRLEVQGPRKDLGEQSFHFAFEERDGDDRDLLLLTEADAKRLHERLGEAIAVLGRDRHNFLMQDKTLGRSDLEREIERVEVLDVAVFSREAREIIASIDRARKALNSSDEDAVHLCALQLRGFR